MIHADAFIEVDKDITLRRLSRENAQEKFDLIIANHDHLLPWLPWADFYHEIDDMYNYTDSEIEKFDNGIAFSYDIYYKDQLAGSIDFNNVSEENHRVELGYWLGEEFTGKGIVTRAAAAMTKYALEKLNINRVAILACTDNTASVNVAKRLNFTEEGTLRGYLELPDGVHDVIVYSKLKADA
ncbi:GNAT family N-acetyltransferase [Candidatus Saccharibacteria bacterium]|nr:GNAT family N-acetyltransferase [Candidatus Saccharibacteria bacterium]